MRTFLIDTDTASDDAVAIIVALRNPGVRVAAITVVNGNVSLKQGVTNALYAAQLCNSDVPVFAGADRPLLRRAAHAGWFHGKDGLGDMNYPPPTRRAESTHAIDAIIETIAKNPGIEIVTPAAEYNIWCDPEAAAIVFRSGLNSEMVGWQLCRGDANLRAGDIDRIRAMNTELAQFTIDSNRTAMEANRTQSGEIGIALPDPIAMAVALDPTIALESSRHHVEIECHSELTRGQTVVDQLNVGNDERNRGLWSSPAATGHAATKPINVIWQIDIPKWKELLTRSLL